jgi:hypothetical protein
VAKLSVTQQREEKAQLNCSGSLSVGKGAEEDSERGSYGSIASLYLTDRHTLQEKMGFLM